jgi:predicted ester cyclase
VIERLLAPIVAVAALSVACKDDRAANERPSSSGEGTAAKTAAGPAPAPAPVEKSAKPVAGAELIAKIDGCWSMLQSWNKDAYAECFAPKAEVTYVDNIPPQKVESGADAVVQAGIFRNAFPDFQAERELIMTKGNKWLVVARLSGTHQGTSLGFPPTGKSISTLWAEVGELGADGRIARTRNYMDQSTLLHQLGILESETALDSEKKWGPPVRAVAKDDKAERSNLDVVKGGLDAMGKADVAGALKMYAQDAEFRYLPEGKPYVGSSEIKERLTSYVAISKQFAMSSHDAWAAGDWVVVELTTSGALSRDLPGAKGTKGMRWEQNSLELFQLAANKVKRHWSFANGLKFAADLGLFDPASLTAPSADTFPADGQ